MATVPVCPPASVPWASIRSTPGRHSVARGLRAVHLGRDQDTAGMQALHVT